MLNLLSIPVNSFPSSISRGKLFLPVGWQVSTTRGGLHGVEHLQVEGTDVALALRSCSRQLWTQPEVSTGLVPRDTEVTGVPTGLAGVTTLVFGGEVALALVPKGGTNAARGLNVIGPLWVLLVELLKLLLPLLGQSSAIPFP